MLSNNKYLQEILERVPENPGIYQYFDKKGTVIYVGKAKNLKRRVHSYFNKSHDDSPKTRILVSKIADLKYTVVENEMDALLLENNLIKKHKPRYNILLKDDKTYPSICIKREPFPRIFMTRKIVKDGSEYFGPYSSVPMVYTLLDLIKKIYPIRTCAHCLDKVNIENHQYQVCLYYHLKKCKAPCVAYQSEEEYNDNIKQIREILKGNLKEVELLLKTEMQDAAENLAFEKAQEVKDKLQLLENYRSKSYIANSNLNNLDVFSYDENEQSAFINYLNIANGSIVQTYTIEYKKQIEEDKESILASGIFEIRQKLKSRNKKILVPFIPSFEEAGVDLVVPKRGDAKKLMDLSLRNVKQYKLDLLKQQEKLNPEQKSTRLMTKMKEDLHLKEIPWHIECFDNSNIQGTNPVASCVVFKKGKPSKKDYRHFKIKTVIGANDFASMEEILTRRYSRLLKEESELPQLVIVDGGKGQLHSAVTAMSNITKNEIFDDWSEEDKRIGQEKIDKIQLIGIAKRLEELFFPGDSIPLYLDKRSETLKVIQHLRDEAHRFGITFHRNLRSKAQIHSELDDIKNIGEKTKNKLLKEFKSLAGIKKASKEAIVACIGESKGHIIYDYFHTKTETNN